MDTRSSQTRERISSVIGSAICSLISAGKQVEKNALLAHLKISEAHAVDGMKKVYGAAIHLVKQSPPVKED
ncbi:hypothetical protein LU196_17960 [Pantoea sp. Mb-10]|uniref:hypothetical protein n=1 Tax=unclassified Pantoea TaxID=2630326 RepID=UPI001E39C400|nr:MULTISPECIES: hypothetical protein [unclassified Pantoea]MCE0491922.1 hypothetical protein [Pantoea sp. Mb-10]MCE0503341.1 hypothetical protein [Pantoea sp. Pb-8]